MTVNRRRIRTRAHRTIVLLSLVLAVTGCATASPSPSRATPSRAAPSGATQSRATPGTTPGSDAASSGCADVRPAVLPTWARAGFSDAEPRAPFVLGHAGRILGVLFGYPLLAPPDPGRGNKILWVSREVPPPGSLVIEARMDGRSTPVLREVSGGPGPSIIDLPAAGCWHLTLRWSGQSDTLDLRYNQPRSPTTVP